MKIATVNFLPRPQVPNSKSWCLLETYHGSGTVLNALLYRHLSLLEGSNIIKVEWHLKG